MTQSNDETTPDTGGISENARLRAENEQIKKENAEFAARLSRYTSHNIENLSPEDRATFSIPERRYMSVSFTDLRGFTAMSEKLTPDEVRVIINIYLTEAIRAVTDNGATVDKIVGDEVMALYGAPKYYKDHAFRAVKTAIDQQEYLRAKRAEYAKAGKTLPECGIGVNTGEMIVGNIGSETRQDYTVLGASVNLAARLCGAARAGQVLITEAVLKEMLDGLPEGWSFEQGTSGMTVQITELGGKTEGVFELAPDIAGREYTFFCNKNKVWQFRYLYAVKVKGVEQPLPVIEALSAARTEDAGITAEELRKSLSDDRAQSGSTKVFGKYRLIKRIASYGGMETWQARDMFGNDVALKLLLAEGPQSAALAARLTREAEAMKALNHKNIRHLLRVGIYENIHYLALEYLHGATLNRVLHAGTKGLTGNIEEIAGLDIQEVITAESKPAGENKKAKPEPAQTEDKSSPAPSGMPVGMAIEIISGLLDGLTHLHSRGLIHRDIRPGHIMITPDGKAVIMDLGSAVFRGKDEAGALSASEYDRSPAFDCIAPECAGETVSSAYPERADIFSAGSVLYRLLTGRPWFTPTGNPDADYAHIRNCSVPDPRGLVPGLDADIAAIIGKAMERDAAHRYVSASAFRADLDKYKNGDPVSARKHTVLYVLSKKYRKHRTVINAVGAAAAVLIISGVFFWGQRLKEIATWGRPLFTEQFSDESWRTNWTQLTGTYTVTNQKLVTTDGGSPNFYFLLNKKLHGSVALEMDAMFLPGFKPCDLSFFFTKNTNNFLSDTYYFMTGTQYNVKSGIQHYINSLSFVSTSLETNQWYRIRIEIDGTLLALYIDGKKICEYDDPFVPGAGWAGIYSYGAGDMFDNVAVYTKGVAEKVSILALGDGFYTRGDWQNAAAEYTRAADSQAGNKTGIMARYKEAVCLQRMGNEACAKTAFQSLLITPLKYRAAVMLSGDLFKERKDTEVLQVLKTCLRKGDATDRSLALHALLTYAQECDPRESTPYLDAYADHTADREHCGRILISDIGQLYSVSRNILHLGNIDSAITTCNTVLAEYSDYETHIHNARLMKHFTEYFFSDTNAGLHGLRNAQMSMYHNYSQNYTLYYAYDNALACIFFNTKNNDTAGTLYHGQYFSNITFFTSSVMAYNFYWLMEWQRGNTDYALSLLGTSLAANKNMYVAGRLEWLTLDLYITLCDRPLSWEESAVPLMELIQKPSAAYLNYFLSVSASLCGMGYSIHGDISRAESLFTQASELALQGNKRPEYLRNFTAFHRSLTRYYNNAPDTLNYLTNFTHTPKRHGELFRQYGKYFHGLWLLRNTDYAGAEAIWKKLAADTDKSLAAVCGVILGTHTTYDLWETENRPWLKSMVWYFLGEYYLARNEQNFARRAFTQARENIFLMPAQFAYLLSDWSSLSFLVYAEARLRGLR